MIDEGVIHTFRKDADSDSRSDGNRMTGCSATTGYGLAVNPFVTGHNGTGLSAGLLAYYTFDATTGTDSSGNGKHGTVQNGVAFGPGKFGTAAQFDGVNDSITISVSHPSGTFTKAARIKPNLEACDAGPEGRCTIIGPYREVYSEGSIRRLDFYRL